MPPCFVSTPGSSQPARTSFLFTSIDLTVTLIRFRSPPFSGSAPTSGECPTRPTDSVLSPFGISCLPALHATAFLDWEISRYWGLHFTWVNTLFFANRYGTLRGHLPVVMEYFWSESSSPAKIKPSDGCSKRVLTLMIIITVAAVAVGLWSVLTGKAVDKSTNLPLYFGCNYYPTSREQGLSLAAAWAGVAVFDCIIFILTLYKVFSRRHPSGNLLAVLLRDVYRTLLSPYTRGIATTFTIIISSVMITRLMLNLRDPALMHMAGQSTTLPHTGNIRFAPWCDATALETGIDAAADIELSDRRDAVEPSRLAVITGGDTP
ncbi:hypothetical protein DFH06DRAFT_1151351 [Mycena polygramma]|nr:hypothetical protein DFH06DRAFT_1151351 [Mycena polygramma]